MKIKIGDLIADTYYTQHTYCGRVVRISKDYYITEEETFNKRNAKKIKSILYVKKLCKHCGRIEEKKLTYNSTNTNYIYTKERKKDRLRCIYCGMKSKQEYVITERLI